MDSSFDGALAQADGAYDAQDYRRALSLYLRLAMQGCIKAQRQTAIMLDFGEGCRANPEAAVGWHRMAAEQGDPESQSYLATSLATGDGVRRDLAEAARWFRRAAQQGNCSAQIRLGKMYEHGEGVPRDWRRAVHWYRLAALQDWSEPKGLLLSLLGRMAMAAE